MRMHKFIQYCSKVRKDAVAKKGYHSEMAIIDTFTLSGVSFNDGSHLYMRVLIYMRGFIYIMMCLIYTIMMSHGIT